MFTMITLIKATQEWSALDSCQNIKKTQVIILQVLLTTITHLFLPGRTLHLGSPLGVWSYTVWFTCVIQNAWIHIWWNKSCMHYMSSVI